MPAFFDATCIKCHKRYGWFGEVKDRPPCPKCRYMYTLAENDADAKEIEAFKEILRKRNEVRRQKE